MSKSRLEAFRTILSVDHVKKLLLKKSSIILVMAQMPISTIR